MSLKEEIQESITALFKTSELLIKLQHTINELTPCETPKIDEIFRKKLLQLSTDVEPNEASQLDKDEKSLVLNFTQKELKSMPRLKDCTIRKKKNGIYEIRYRKHKYNVSFSSKSLTVAKEKAQEWLALYNQELDNKEYFKIVKLDKTVDTYSNQVIFSTFASDYLKKIKKPRLKPNTFKSYMHRFRKYILPYFGKYRIAEIQPSFIQPYLDSIKKRAPRLCEDIVMLLNGIFNYALDNAIIPRNPMKAVYIEKHEREHGLALTIDEEKQFLERIKGSEEELVYVVTLFAGLRRCEIKSATFNIEDNTITIKNGKLKNYQKNYYRIVPIYPKFKSYLSRLASENWKKYVTNAYLAKFPTLCPNHKLKDLRHTFTTRAKSCEIKDEVVSLWTGHSLKSITERVYTHYSMEYMQKQAKKLNY